MPTAVGVAVNVKYIAPPRVVGGTGSGGGVSTAGQPIGLLLALTKAS
jgi:hypothetical protein